MKEILNKIRCWDKILYYIYFFLFIFTMINREFLLFKMDLRYVLLPVGIILILIEIYNRLILKKNCEKYFDKDFKTIFIFYVWIIICNISWMWNGLEINRTKFLNEMILIINNFIGIIIFYLYKEYLNRELLNRIIVFSSCILILSFILIGVGYDITRIANPNEIYVYVSSKEAPDHINAFGLGYRIGGFAQDPNYASILLVIAIIATLQLKIKKVYKTIITIILLLALGFAASKTILIASILGIIYTIIIKFSKPKLIKKINIILLTTIICFILVVLNLKNLKVFFPSTMTTRFAMWEMATELFKKSVIIGNGITSFRSFFSVDNWYIQAHSTYMQIMCETGLVGIGIFLKIMYNNLNNKKISNVFLTIVYLIFAINFETIALQFFIYIIYIMNIDTNTHKPNGKKALFIVNSLSNGGAEKVCINMANELANQNYKVDFFVLNQGHTYDDIDSRFNIYNFKINYTNKLMKILNIFIIKSKMDELIMENEKEEYYSLITSHLPMSNLLTRLSIIRNRAIYVFHTTMKFYDKNNSKLFRYILKYIFNNKKIVTVSKGVEKQCIEDYGMKYCNIKTIYNPINIEEINEKKDKYIDVKKPYILHIGRFSKEKRQDRMVDIFYKGKLYNDFQLIFCGTGETENTIKNKVKDLGIENEVVFLGWQDNIYKWLFNCNLVVCTSDIEAFPMTLIEAFACKAKVVSSDCEFGPSEILLGEYANYLVESNNIDEYILKIKEALETYPTVDNKILGKCKANNVVKEYIEFYE